MSFTPYALSCRKLVSLPVVFALLCSVNGNAATQIDEPQSLTKLYQQVAASPLRTDDDRQADAARKPVEFLQFAKVRPGMTVLDVATGRGYTTQLLALAVGSNGTVWAQADKARPELTKRLADHPQSNIQPLIRPYDDPIPADAPKLDLITLILNYHDIAYLPVDRNKMNQRLFSALKSGGHLIVIDHSAKKGEGVTVAKSLHRIDEAVVLDELRQAGFQLEQEGDFLHNAADPREQAFFNMKMPTDSFALRFVRPSGDQPGNAWINLWDFAKKFKGCVMLRA